MKPGGTRVWHISDFSVLDFPNRRQLPPSPPPLRQHAAPVDTNGRWNSMNQGQGMTKVTGDGIKPLRAIRETLEVGLETNQVTLHSPIF
ncbi:hypothetical protein CI238_07049 [Colletotrichum incanum]|uniref:Uncharacterized protein n=1 Tax=Colletotrichum incanum TaxID=1573173 RepID=A0A166ZGK4_COLIC|nr:hypothetical protein CI238_07049 [Colletotrichum incanum]